MDLRVEIASRWIRIRGAVLPREPKDQVIYRLTIVMVLMMLVVVDVTNMHVVTHRTCWMQREWLWVVVAKARGSAVANHVALVVLLVRVAIAGDLVLSP